MMSDEEDVGNNTFKVHPPQWRSAQLNQLLSELDRRAGTAINKAHPRKSRVIGTPCKSSTPSAAKGWMICEGEDNGSPSPTY